MDERVAFPLTGGLLERHETARCRDGFLQERLQPERRPRLIVVKRDGSAIAVTAGRWTDWKHPLRLDTIRSLEELLYLGEYLPTGEHIFATDEGNVTAAFLRDRTWSFARDDPAWQRPPPSVTACLGLALSLVQWHLQHRYCPACGARTSAREDGGLSRRCLGCQTPHFPRLMPAVLVVVLDGGGRVLLSQRHAASPRWSLLAGFVLHGESAEEAVRREVAEESGARVESLRYVGSHPWPYPYVWMLCYDAVAPHTPHLVVQAEELHRVEWIAKADVRRALAGQHASLHLPGPGTTPHRLLQAWVEGRVGEAGEVISAAGHL